MSVKDAKDKELAQESEVLIMKLSKKQLDKKQSLSLFFLEKQGKQNKPKWRNHIMPTRQCPVCHNNMDNKHIKSKLEVKINESG